jgi:hypothetical protein
MNSLTALAAWTLQPTARIEREIDEEFDFHLDCRIRELTESGCDPAEARAVAEREFGSRAHWHGECRNAQLGPQRWLVPLASVIVVVPMLLTIGWLYLRLGEVQARNEAMRAELQAQRARAVALLAADIERNDLTGEVRDSAGKPVSNANVVVIHKSWPNNRYRQDSLRASTDKEGRFRLPKLYVPNTQVAFNVTVLAEGHAMHSEYVLRKAGEKVTPFTFTLQPALPKTLVIKDGKGQALANTVVFPTSRRTNPAKEHLIYYQSAEDCGFKTDGQGKVRMSVFAADDEVDLGVMTEPESNQVTFKVDGAAEQAITLPSKK